VSSCTLNLIAAGRAAGTDAGVAGAAAFLSGNPAVTGVSLAPAAAGG